MSTNDWVSVASDGSARVLKYTFGFGTANTLALKLDDGTWMVISPACRVPDSALDTLAKDGEVSALVAPNAFHHLGQTAWRARFPKAVSYAPEGSLLRLAKQSRDVPYRPLSELTAKLPQRVQAFVPAGMKADDLIVHAGTKDGAVWFGGDLISNTKDEDISWFPRMMFKLLGGGTGYRFNKVPSMVYLRDAAAWKADMKKRAEATPAALMVPAHGDVVRDAAAQTLAVFS